jgi:hypothetical protein
MILICLLFVSFIIIYFCHLLQNSRVSRHKSKKLKVPEKKKKKYSVLKDFNRGGKKQCTVL